MGHLDLAAGEPAGAGAADALAARVRRVQALVDQDVEHAAARRPRQLAGLAVQATSSVAAMPPVGSVPRTGCPPATGTAPRARAALARPAGQRLPDDRQVGVGAADERLVAGVRPGQRRQRGHRRRPVQRVEPVHHEQPLRAAAQLAQLGGEDDRALVAVGVDQHDPAAPGRQRRLEDGHDRGDPAAAGEQQEVGVERARGERARPGGSTSSTVPAARGRRSSWRHNRRPSA